MVSKKDVRPAIAAGKFYSLSADILEKETKALIAENNQAPNEKTFALIAPHAGYKYAGTIYGSAYAVLKGQSFKTALILGNSHHSYFDGVSVYDKGAFTTPLGDCPVDAALARNIISMDAKIKADFTVHSMEHSIEVHLPFLKSVLGNIKIVPVLMGNDLMSTCRLLASALKGVIKDRKDILIISSTDLSHYPSYDDAYKVDNEVLDMIVKGDALRLENLLHELELRAIPGAVSFLCGAGSVKTVMLLAKEMGATEIRKLKYANSGDAIDDKSGVVGYGAISFSFPQSVSPQKEAVESDMLKKSDKDELIKIARLSVEAKIKGEVLPEFKPVSYVLNSARGAFVTIKKGGKLRGCIGRIITNEPLFKTVQAMAIEAATADSRFIPIAPDELSGLEYEISILSPMEKVTDPYKDIELGKHGVQIKKGFRTGIFLPQVANETGWDFERFMGELCEGKAGLAREEWKNKSAEIYKFTAEVVGE